MNELKSNLLIFEQKYQRLQIVHDIKKNRPVEIGDILQNGNDQLSEVSQYSQGTYTSIRTAGGGRKKQNKNKSFLTRKIKEGSFYEE